MKFTLPRILIIVLSLSLYTNLHSQETDTLQQKISLQYLEKAGAQASALSSKLDKKAAKVLAKFQKQEEKMRAKLMKIDSSAAKELFNNAAAKYKGLEEKLKNGGAGQYIPKLDTLVTSLKFLQNNSELLEKGKEAAVKLKETMGKVDGLKDKFQQAETIKQFIKERKQFLKDQLGKFGFAKELKKLNKEVYYYTQQVNEYKEILKDSKKAEKKAIELLSKTKLFKDFMRKNSMLASLFRLPGDPNDPSAQVSLAGLQTRTQVNNLIQQQIAAGGPNAQAQFRQNIQDAQSQLNQLKDKVMKMGGGSSDAELPDFKPNNQKTKSFLQRLEYGTNIQSQKANAFFPVTSDIGLSIGYKLNDKSIIGIGSSFKMGWGTGFNNIRISSQGVGLRSYLDYKIKGSFWISGGYEMNYRSAINSIAQLQPYSAWQRSGLVGLSKVVSLKTKFFKKTKLQLLWDFLSYEQVPRVQPLVFRVSYNIK
ncbi:MAG: hypothetical protein JNJ86_08760 [Chitinophagaceae bacterium]|nr:hypothetical protein [Chitinophagaceae bacterium]